MSVKFETFIEYQSQYEKISFSDKITQEWQDFRNKGHHAITYINKLYQGPDFVIKVVQFSVSIFDCFLKGPSSLEIPKHFCKEAKNITNFIKGLKSFDGFLHFNWEWKAVILNLSGMTLFVFSTITLGERVRLLNASNFKNYLARIPRIGSLPFGGLLVISRIGFTSMMIFSSIDKKKKLKQKENHIQEKLHFWKRSLTFTQVRKRQVKYKEKVQVLRKEISAYQKLIRKGEQEKELLPLQENEKLKACQKALQELKSISNEKEIELAKYQKKYAQWNKLKRKWKHIDLKSLEEIRQAKEKKWLHKLHCAKLERKALLLTRIKDIATLSKSVLVIGSVASGYGIVAVPLLSIGCDLLASSFDFAAFFQKRAANKIKISPIDVTYRTSCIGQSRCISQN